MPLDSFIHRIIGSETYTMNDLKEITEFTICAKGEDVPVGASLLKEADIENI